MANLVYSMLMSLDGFVADANGWFDWATPNDTDLQDYMLEMSAGIGTYLFGRRMYGMMTYWETAGDAPGASAFEKRWARHWADTEKVVYSHSLAEPMTVRTRVLRTFDPTEVAALKRDAARDVCIAGPMIAAQGLAAGLVDEVQAFVCPVLVGGGTRFFPDGYAAPLHLLEERRFGSGVVLLRHKVGG